MTAPENISIELLNGPISDDDFESIIDLRQQLSLSDKPVDADLLRKNTVDMIGGNQTYPFVARDKIEQGRIVGFTTLIAVYGLGVRKGWIEDVVVDEDYRGRGISEALEAAQTLKCRELELTEQGLTSNCARVAAHKFYAKLGFEEPETTLLTRDL